MYFVFSPIGLKVVVPRLGGKRKEKEVGHYAFLPKLLFTMWSLAASVVHTCVFNVNLKAASSSCICSCFDFIHV